jgi:hypothetical protein
MGAATSFRYISGAMNFMPARQSGGTMCFIEVSFQEITHAWHRSLAPRYDDEA